MGLGGSGIELLCLLPLLLLLHHREHLRRLGIKLPPPESVLPIVNLVS